MGRSQQIFQAIKATAVRQLAAYLADSTSTVTEYGAKL